MKQFLLWSLLYVSSVAFASSYEHPLQRGGGNLSTTPDFHRKQSNYLSAKAGGVSGEELLFVNIFIHESIRNSRIKVPKTKMTRPSDFPAVPISSFHRIEIEIHGQTHP